MHGWFCPINLTHLIGWKLLHFEKLNWLVTFYFSMHTLHGYKQVITGVRRCERTQSTLNVCSCITLVVYETDSWSLKIIQLWDDVTEDDRSIIAETKDPIIKLKIYFVHFNIMSWGYKFRNTVHYIVHKNTQFHIHQ